MKKFKARICAILTACIVCALMSGYAVTGITGASPARAFSFRPYERVTIYIDGILSNTVGYVSGSRAYMSIDSFCEALGVEHAHKQAEEGEALRAEVFGVTVTIPDSLAYIDANGRYFLLSGSVKYIRGDMCLPVAELCRLVGAGVRWDPGTESIDIDSTYLRPLRAGEDSYNEEDLLWLSRIIDAEAGGETLSGKIGVGNVVMNRAASPSFPDTIYDVVFDSAYGVQFTPAETGSIYNDPREESVIAAKICLEGYNVVGDSLYFVNPDVGVSSWFRETRTFVATIGDHDFYA